MYQYLTSWINQEDIKPQGEKMRAYENLIIIKPTLTEEEIQNQYDLIDETISANKGEIVERLKMGLRNLAYEIKKQKRGYYYIIYFKMDPKNISEIERIYKINENILKYVTIKYDSKKEVKNWEKLIEKANNKKESTKEEISLEKDKKETAEEKKE